MTNNSKVPNRLISEKSPYLLQHAYNPVDWNPWGEEAFAKAKTGDKPIFLSIGYSTCHWCHVMEGESFENEEIAELLNRDFICVKVDREERPDIDAVYMAACQAFTGSGGWPLTIFMTPDQKPFFAATYIPPESRFGMIGMKQLLLRIKDHWKNDRERLIQSGEAAGEFLKERAARRGMAGEPKRNTLDQAVMLLGRQFDPEDGGFGSAPKFPSPHILLFLLQYAKLEDTGQEGAGPDIALTMAEKTLQQMFQGGIFDHIGGGFSRYSTDRHWLAPHFEKMLYDNALLTLTYAEAYWETRKALYRQVAEQILTYVLRELTDEAGGFYCGQDADSEGVEGKYYVLTPAEVTDVLGKEAGLNFCRQYDITSRGNFEGKSIPNLLNNPEFEELVEGEKEQKNALYHYRLERTKLHKDDKVLTSWNGLMIAALARAYQIMEVPEYLEAAKKARRFILEKLKLGTAGETGGQERLAVRFREGESAGEGKLDDYAFYIWGLLELYQATFEEEYLEEAGRLAQTMIGQFWDEGGGFFLYGKEAEQLIIRPKELYDGAIPSGNSVAALILGRLAKFTKEPHWEEISKDQLAFLSGETGDYPPGYCFALIAMLERLHPMDPMMCCKNGVCTVPFPE